MNAPQIPEFGAVSVVDIGRLLGSQPRTIAVLGAFFDDSGTHSASPVVAFGGLLGTEAQWDAFAPAWSALLAEPLPGKPPLKQFHLTPLRARVDEFEPYNRVEQDYINHLFKKIILDVGLVTLAAAVDKQAWNELVVGPVLENEFGRPEEYCFVKCVDLVIDTIRARKPGERVYFFFDQGTRDRLENWAKLYLTQAERYPEIEGFGFAKVSDVVALQGADLIATETYQFGQAWLENPENPKVHPQFEDFRYRDLSAGAILMREHIAEMVARWKQSRGG